jgi:hypothetical protein
MQCPPKVAEVVCDILRTGLLRIRCLDDALRCHSEADHLHNLPTLLTKFTPELLEFYWSVERACFIKRSTPQEIEAFEPLWNALVAHVD